MPKTTKSYEVFEERVECCVEGGVSVLRPAGGDTRITLVDLDQLERFTRWLQIKHDEARLP